MAEKINKQDEIKILDSEVEAVRQLPDVYIGALGNHGFKNMYREILQNSLDEIIKGNTLDKNIVVSYDERSKIVIIEDNGQGIPTDKIVPVFSKLHSSSNYNKVAGSGKYSSGKNGMGGTITNFLSKFFIVETYRMDGSAAKVEFEEGLLNKKGLQNIKCTNGKHGMIVTFAPSDMMGEIDVTHEELEELTWMMVNLCKPSTKVIFNAINSLGQKSRKVIENKNGIFDMISSICNKPVFSPIHFCVDNGTMKLEVLLTYDISNMDDPKILGFANMCPAMSGTHIDGFLDAVVKYFRDYMNKIYLANNKKLTVNAQDIRTGLRAVVSSFHLFPMFTGQSKEVFSKEDMKPFAMQETIKALDAWASSNPTDLQKISKYFKDVCEIRSKSDNDKIKMSDKYTSSAVTGYPAKYKKPNGNKNVELIITEGDSAASGIENNRDKSRQGVFGIRGKMPNAFTTPTKKYFENEEVAGIFKICGYNGYSRRFDPDKFRLDKVIIAADGDADGAHICTLTCGLFLRYLPFAIEQGKIYKATPPLYGLALGKDKYKFFADNIEYIEYVQDIFCKQNVIADINKKNYNKRQITQLLHKNMYYAYELEKVANTYSINPYLLEMILFNNHLKFNSFKSIIEKTYKFVKVEQERDTIIIKGLVDSKYQTIFLNDKLIADCYAVIDLLANSEKYYIVNGKMMSLYGLMKLFNSFEPSHLTRYKGLGEMPPKLLGKSTIIPGEGRILKQYTIEDAKKELEYFTNLQSDKGEFIKGIKIRKEDIV